MISALCQMLAQAQNLLVKLGEVYTSLSNLRVASCELQVASCELQITHSMLASCNIHLRYLALKQKWKPKSLMLNNLGSY